MAYNLYHYTECGLDTIFLTNGYTINEEGSLHIENIHELHKAIGQCLIHSTEKLAGKEIRFIRQYFDLSQKKFGELLGVDKQTVMRWENKKTIITETSDRLLRVLFSDVLDMKEDVVEFLQNLSDIDAKTCAEEEHFVFDNGKWEREYSHAA